LLQRGKATNMERGNLTVLPTMRIHCRRIRYRVDRSHKYQKTEKACNDVSEFHNALEQGKTLALIGSSFRTEFTV
jgi:hypothetical protein